MDELNAQELYKSISQYVDDKKRAISILSDYFKCDPELIFYKFLKKEIADQGQAEGGKKFFFHGYGCTVKDQKSKLNIELEFGPCGQAYAFDKNTLCHFLGFKADEYDRVIKFLVDNKIVKLANEKLFELLKQNSEYNNWDSEEQEMDACVADRYVFVE